MPPSASVEDWKPGRASAPIIQSPPATAAAQAGAEFPPVEDPPRGARNPPGDRAGARPRVPGRPPARSGLAPEGGPPPEASSPVAGPPVRLNSGWGEGSCRPGLTGRFRELLGMLDLQGRKGCRGHQVGSSPAGGSRISHSRGASARVPRGICGSFLRILNQPVNQDKCEGFGSECGATDDWETRKGLPFARSDRRIQSGNVLGWAVPQLAESSWAVGEQVAWRIEGTTCTGCKARSGLLGLHLPGFHALLGKGESGFEQ